MKIEIVDYKGRVFTKRLVVLNENGRNWFVFAHNLPGIGRDCYGGNVIKCIAWAKEKPLNKSGTRTARNGWRTKKEATVAMLQIAAALMVSANA